MLKNAYSVISASTYSTTEDMKSIVKNYQEKDYLIDYAYRMFYYYLDLIEETESFEKLQILVENIYTNEYLNNLNDYVSSLGNSVSPFNHSPFLFSIIIIP